jgi:hypothetical protein
MPETFLAHLAAARYAGSGINHEAQKFTGHLVIRPAHGGALLWFRATGETGEIYHEEITLIAKTFAGTLSMTSLNSNIPAAQHFASETITPNSCSFITGDFANPQTFRERVTLTFGPDSVTYAFAWGLPGQAVEPRSSATMTATNETPPGCPIQL